MLIFVFIQSEIKFQFKIIIVSVFMVLLFLCYPINPSEEAKTIIRVWVSKEGNFMKVASLLLLSFALIDGPRTFAKKYY